MILALETSSSLCSVCVLDRGSGQVIAEISNDIGRGHAERLMDDIADVLKEAGVSYAALSGVAVGVGPGSFTGIRVGVAAARGLGFALKVPVLGVTSLQAIAVLARSLNANRRITVLLDAGRGEIHVQSFDHEALPLDNPQAMSSAGFLPYLSLDPVLICGSGSVMIAPEMLPGNVKWAEDKFVATANAVARAVLHPQMIVPAKPLYLRAADAKTQAGFALERSGA